MPRRMLVFLLISLGSAFLLDPLETLAQDSRGASAALPGAGEVFGLQAFVDGRLAAGDTKIIVPPGRYRVVPRGGHHLLLHDLDSVEIIADGVEMVCTETTRAVTISHCRNVTLRGLVIDYDPLPFTQGRIESMSPDKKSHEIALFDGYPAADLARRFKYEIFRADTRTLRSPDYDFSLAVVDPRHIRVTKSRSSANDPEQIGDIAVIGAEYAPGGSIPHAVECGASAGVRLENIRVWASNCFGFIEVNCDGTTYDHCRIDRRPASNDPVSRADSRVRSLNADAYHSKHALRGPALIGCVARFMGDDAVNICGDYHMITGCQGAELRVLAKHELNVAVGEPVELFGYDGVRHGDAVVLRIEPDGMVNEAEKLFLEKQRLDEHFRTAWNAHAYTITLDRAVDLPLGSLLASTRRMGNGFLVQDCDFGSNRSRGILIKASNGRVIDNRIAGCRMESIKVAPEYWWLESGSSNEVEIRGNTIRDCPSVGIAVYALGRKASSRPRRRITGSRCWTTA